MEEQKEEKKEHPSTYVVQDRSSVAEMERLRIQDTLFTTSMGGLLPEQDDPARFESVLDVGCGTGGWLIEMARTYPHISRLVGVDISGLMLNYAREQAAAAGVGDRVEFYVMDALRMLEFPDDSFDLINQRLAISYMRTWDWPKLLQEFQRVGRSEATIRLTESDMPTSSGEAGLFMRDLLTQAFVQAGHFQQASGDDLLKRLPDMLRRYCEDSQVQTRLYRLEYRGGTPEGQNFYEDSKRLLPSLPAFLSRFVRLPDDFAEIGQRALDEMQEPTCVTVLHLMTAYGTLA